MITGLHIELRTSCSQIDRKTPSGIHSARTYAFGGKCILGSDKSILTGIAPPIPCRLTDGARCYRIVIQCQMSVVPASAPDQVEPVTMTIDVEHIIRRKGVEVIRKG